VDGANTFRATAFSKDRTESNPFIGDPTHLLGEEVRVRGFVHSTVTLFARFLG